MLTFARCVCLLREQTDLACASLIPAHTRAPSIIAGPQATVPPPAGDAPPLPTRLADNTAEQPRDTPLSLRAQQCWLIDAHSSQASIITALCRASAAEHHVIDWDHIAHQ